MSNGERYEIIPWRIFSYIVSSALLIFQQGALLYYMYQYQTWSLYLLMLDIPFLLYWLLCTVPKLVGINGATCWLNYCRLMTLKFLVLYYLVLPNYVYETGIILNYTCGAFTEIMFLLLLTPTLYTIMAFRTGVHLYGGLNAISSERLVHTDMIIHVAIDFLDIVDMSNTFSVLTSTAQDNYNVMQLFCGIVASTCIFLHAYSFPRMNEASKANVNPTLESIKMQLNSNSKSDVYFCRKYAGIVGIFFVDIPFGIFRLVAWLMLGRHDVFAPFLLKNLCFIAMQAQKIRYCAIGIKSTSTTSEPSQPPAPQACMQNQEDSDQTKDSKLNATLLKRDTGVDKYGTFSSTSVKNETSRVGAFSNVNVNSSTLPSSRIHPFNMVTANLASTWKSGIIPETGRSVQNAFLSREPCNNYTMDISDLHATSIVEAKRIIQKIMLMIGVGSKPEMAHVLDSNLTFSLWYNVLLMLPHVSYWMAEFVIVVALYQLDREAFSAEVVGLAGIENFKWSTSPTLLKVGLCSIAIASFVNLVCWTLLGPFWDALFVAILVLVRLVSYSLVLLSISEFVPSAYILEIVATLIMGTGKDYLYLIFGIRPFFNLLNGLYPFLCVALGKSRLFYINPSVYYNSNNKKKKSDLLESVKIIGSFGLDGIGMDETCAFSLSAYLMLTNARNICASSTSHALLMSKNLIKSYRLNRILVACHLRSILISLVLRGYCILTIVGPGVVDYSFALVVYGVHVVILAIYLVLSLIQRLLSIEAALCQVMCLDIAGTISLDPNGLAPSQSGACAPIQPDGAIYNRYKQHKYLAESKRSRL